MRRSCLLTAVVLFTIPALAQAAKPGDWPQWRGPNRDGSSLETNLLDAWPEDGPSVVWERDDVGAGYATVVIADGRVLTQGDVDGEGRIQCFDERTGERLWSVRPPAEIASYKNSKRGSGPRGAPTVDGERAYVEGDDGALTCLEAATGRIVWSLHLVEDFEAGRTPNWGYSESPLIVGDLVVVTPGGADGAVAALDKHTGKVLWRSDEVTDPAHYSSPIIADVHGLPQIIQFTRARVVGLDARNGNLLWDYAGSANNTANCATPIFADGCAFSSSGYNTGGGLVDLSRDGDDFTAEEVYFEPKMANHHGGIVLVDGYLYGFNNSVLLCMDFKTGEIAWQDRSVGKGSLCHADGHLYCLSERQVMGLVEANPDEYVEKGRFRLPESGQNSWAHPVVANGRLYIRDQDRLTSYDVRAK